jgi:glyoxylase-like metal-dependent hydrolase (beta-lactamase superfamily II)/8-oxo-dGTP pyrophosphatase MutT (NUDIX family)
VILWREGALGREVFWVRRGAQLRFAGGFYAFPGGQVDDGDSAIPVAGASGLEAALVASACRELFEEAGVLLARGAERLGAEKLAGHRRSLLSGRVRFGDLLAENGLVLDASLLTAAGRWITPPYAPLRYDARFYLARMPEGQKAEVWPGEHAHGGWVSCAEALAAWRAGRALLHPPNRWAIQCLAAAPPPECLEDLRHPPHVEGAVAVRIDFQENVYLFPLRTPTLPPATHTNCYVVGERELAVVDPGSPDPGELERLFRFLDGFAAEGRRVAEIWLTHHHLDHAGGLGALWERLRVPVRAHPRTADRVAVPCAPVEEGDRLLGRWRALHTPGHARGHLCFYDEASGALLCGDMVSSISTIVIDPPEGDMAQYLAELERLRRLGPRTLYPAHGSAIPDAVGKLEEYLAHRRMREGKVLAALEAPGTLAEVTARAYDDTPAFLLPVAERSCLAALEKLEREGRARRSGERWMRRGES